MAIVRVANRFIDPKTGEIYDWEINHNDETGSPSKGGGQGGVGRNITVSAPLSGGMHILQEAAQDPMGFSWKGTALTREQHQKFLRWYHKCDTQTIILHDFSTDQFEVLIVSYIPQRRAVAQNRNDMDEAPMWVYDFQIDLLVIRQLGGDYYNAGIGA